MPRDFMANDRGKTVVTADGETVGTVKDIDDDMAHVTPDSSLEESVRSRLGWTSEDDIFEIPHSKIDSISDTEVTLERNP